MGMSVLNALFSFIGGLGMFLFGMHIMSEGLQKSAGEKSRRFMRLFTDNRLLGVAVGALITAIVQSSSLTTVMAVGFVNAGMMTLSQAVGIIMGANIGTTLTAWLVSMNEWGNLLRPQFFAPLLLGIGVALLLSGKEPRRRDVGSILAGFGLLFLGLENMSAAVAPYSDSPFFTEAFIVIGTHPLLGIAVGFGVTALLQSSSASLGILRTLAMNGIVTWNSAVYIALGQNIGTCVSALIAGAGAGRNGRCAALIHLLFNTIGAAVFAIGAAVVFTLFPWIGAAPLNSVELALFHTFFNVAATALLFPFADQLEALARRIVKPQEKPDPFAPALDSRILETPAFAFESAKQEVRRMGSVVLGNIESSRKAIVNRSEKAIHRVYENEAIVNRYERELTQYMVHIDIAALNEHQQMQLRHLLLMVNDLEKISDRCKDLAELSELMLKENSMFSIGGYEDLQLISAQSSETLEEALSFWQDPQETQRYQKAVQSGRMVTQLEEQIRDRHIRRLAQQRCQVEAGVLFLDAIGHLQRISSYAVHLADYVREEQIQGA